MNRKLDDEAAFQFWVALGDKRSHAAVAEKFGVRRRGIQKCAQRNAWTQRLTAIDAEARMRSDELLIETKAELRARHLRMLKVVGTRGLQALQRMEIDSAMDGVKAIEAAIKLERVIHGETTDHVAVSMQELTRREVEAFLRTSEDEIEDDDQADADGVEDDDLQHSSGTAPVADAEEPPTRTIDA